MKEDFLFPMSSMTNRLSYASSPDSDLDLRPGSRMYDDDDLYNPLYTTHNAPPQGGTQAPDAGPVRGRRLIRSSSDPSIATGENVPGIPPYPAPPTYQQRPREPRAVHSRTQVSTLNTLTLEN